MRQEAAPWILRELTSQLCGVLRHRANACRPPVHAEKPTDRAEENLDKCISRIRQHGREMNLALPLDLLCQAM